MKGCLPKPIQFFRQMPWNLIVAANDTIVRHGRDCFKCDWHNLNRDGRLNAGVGVIVVKLDGVVCKVVNRLNLLDQV